METMNQRRVSVAATGISKPDGARSSVFDLAKPKRDRIDIASVQIRSNVPVPPTARGPGALSPYEQLISKMKKGDCVTLPEKSAYGFVSRAKKLGIATIRRKTSATEITVWRDS